MDPETLRAVAKLARGRAGLQVREDAGDGLMRLGAQKALMQLAVDLEVSADRCLPPVGEMDDKALVAAYLATDPEDDADLLQLYADEIERRGLDV